MKNKKSVANKDKLDPKIDFMDKKILSALRLNGRISMAELAQKVGLSQSPCWSRVKRLETMEVISGYSAMIDPKSIGMKDLVFIEITLDRHDETILERFGDHLARIPEVLEAYLVAGEYDYLVKAVVSGTEHFEVFLREKLYGIGGVRQSRSTFALRALKQNHSIDPVEWPLGS
ncbi:Lrp/AsnC family transcriptional regulator (plasmid) [Bartonella sp. HY329]|uniref:Lrp/AsnC family transcriptional regulator n=1 Tax=unclassified Bartonella TaxID=2645622 RepID=UPI0021CA1EEE|nr:MULTISPECIES: Lrp/AsnC family transcriptional regulator [unclassified Bartonella]UXM96548.1 Lrp/AsnC family transcriptional regulator [Bartonella sp. HY329]UXN10871.1 Lrp/AsnC family transcriptional regulator [Bartonella sp. HY328]